MTGFTIGVEEEFFLVDPASGALRPDAAGVLDHARDRTGVEVDRELQRWQVETGTRVCATLAEVRADLTRLRRDLAEVAGEAGCRIAAAGSYPLASRADRQITPKDRYEWLAHTFGDLAREQLVCGCHVHVGVDDREIAVRAMNHARLWLGPLLALSANSPFWMGEDTGYASYRSQVWLRWPTSGPPAPFASAAEYDATVKDLIATGVVLDPGMVYLDIRPSAHADTLEFRVADVSLTVDGAVLLAGLIRALVRTAVEAAARGEEPPPVRQEVLAVAQWRAARSGLRGDLVDVVSRRPVPAGTLVRRLVSHVRPALEAHGDLDEVLDLVERTLDGGTAADRQREAHARRGDLGDVVGLLLDETVPPPP